MKQLIKILFLGIVLLSGTTTAQAVTLAELFNGGSIVAGDKLFDRWSFDFYDASDGRDFNAGNIDVTPLVDGDYGLRFSVANNELYVAGDGLYAYVDLMFGFRLSVLDPGYLISGNTLAFDSGGAALSHAVDQSNDLGVYVRETVGTAAGGDDLAKKYIEFSILDEALTSKISDVAAFTPASSVWVTKNILVWAVDESDWATLWGFDQRFSQTVIPEPSTIVLMLVGVAGLAIARKRRS